MICSNNSGYTFIKGYLSLDSECVGKPIVAETSSLKIMRRNARWLCEGCLVESATDTNLFQPLVNQVASRRKIKLNHAFNKYLLNQINSFRGGRM